MRVFGVFLVRIFPVFGLNTEIYRVNLRIQSECGKKQTRETTNTDSYIDIQIDRPIGQVFGGNKNGKSQWKSLESLSLKNCEISAEKQPPLLWLYFTIQKLCIFLFIYFFTVITFQCEVYWTIKKSSFSIGALYIIAFKVNYWRQSYRCI